MATCQLLRVRLVGGTFTMCSLLSILWHTETHTLLMVTATILPVASYTRVFQPSIFSVESPPNQPRTGLKWKSEGRNLVFSAPSLICCRTCLHGGCSQSQRRITARDATFQASLGIAEWDSTGPAALQLHADAFLVCFKSPPQSNRTAMLIHKAQY